MTATDTSVWWVSDPMYTVGNQWTCYKYHNGVSLEIAIILIMDKVLSVRDWQKTRWSSWTSLASEARPIRGTEVPHSFWVPPYNCIVLHSLDPTCHHACTTCHHACTTCHHSCISCHVIAQHMSYTSMKCPSYTHNLPSSTCPTRPACYSMCMHNILSSMDNISFTGMKCPSCMHNLPSCIHNLPSCMYKLPRACTTYVLHQHEMSIIHAQLAIIHTHVPHDQHAVQCACTTCCPSMHNMSFTSTKCPHACMHNMLSYITQ